ncbi:MAG: hypothetical protein KY442_10205, partial [Proteobacteria bacterium]|nr:hypothetical protein [Pseudomonadota bacterium]
LAALRKQLATATAPARRPDSEQRPAQPPARSEAPRPAKQPGHSGQSGQPGPGSGGQSRGEAGREQGKPAPGPEQDEAEPAGSTDVTEEHAPEAMTPSVEGDRVAPLSTERNPGVATTAVDVTHLAVATMGGPGPYLVDSAGHPLYLLEDDRNGSACTDMCLAAWPPLLRSEVPGASAGVEDELIGTVQRADGATQVTYNGHPLYYYAQDTDSGMPTGHDIHDQWGGWYLLSPEGEALHGQES